MCVLYITTFLDDYPDINYLWCGTYIKRAVVPRELITLVLTDMVIRVVGYNDLQTAHYITTLIRRLASSNGDWNSAVRRDSY
jgi:hypothetical protein